MGFLTLFGSCAYGFGGQSKTNKPFLFSLSITLEVVFGTGELEMSAWLCIRELKKAEGSVTAPPKSAAGG